MLLRALLRSRSMFVKLRAPPPRSTAPAAAPLRNGAAARESSPTGLGLFGSNSNKTAAFSMLMCAKATNGGDDHPADVVAAAGMDSQLPEQQGWYQKIAAQGPTAMLGSFSNLSTKGFSAHLAKLHVEKIDLQKGEVIAILPVDEGLANSFNTLHGGVCATLVDVVGTMAHFTRDHRRAGVSTDLNISYLKPARLGDVVTIVARSLSCGRRMAVSEVEFWVGKRMIAIGRHGMALPPPPAAEEKNA